MAVLRYLLLLAALLSGFLTISERLRSYGEWRGLSRAAREERALGGFAPIVDRVRAHVPEQEGILLYAAVDPALFPYALFPRKIYQVRTEPETNSVYMDLPPSPYREIRPESLPVSWVLLVDGENLARGGVLSRMQRRGGGE